VGYKTPKRDKKRRYVYVKRLYSTVIGFNHLKSEENKISGERI
jgi:hypothetical protein